MNILDTILRAKRLEVAAARARKPFGELHDEAFAVTRPTASLSRALRGRGSGIIAEFKRASPSKGSFRPAATVEDVVPGYSAGGAAAISILTDRDYFSGSLDDLSRARELTSKPLLRKDFIVDEYQICQARVAGADAVLLIAAALTRERCGELAAFARSLSLEVLLELHGPCELEYICPNVDAVGVNNRDLTTFKTDTAVSMRMAPLIPEGCVRVSESGISSPEAIRLLRGAGFEGFLVGESFMTRPDPALALREFVERI